MKEPPPYACNHPSSLPGEGIFQSHSSYRPALKEDRQRPLETLKDMITATSGTTERVLDLEDDYFSQELEKQSAQDFKLPVRNQGSVFDRPRQSSRPTEELASSQEVGTDVAKEEATAPIFGRSSYEIPFANGQESKALTIARENIRSYAPALKQNSSHQGLPQPPFDKLSEPAVEDPVDQHLRDLAKRLVKSKRSFILLSD